MMNNIQIHATNINGLGASQVVVSFLQSFERTEEMKSTIVYLPSSGAISNYNSKYGEIINYKRYLPNALSRVVECLFSNFLFENKPTIVLGDIPLRGINNQIVLVHQPNLIYPKVNPNSSKSLTFKISRLLFSMNHKFAKTIVVQTGAMAKDLITSYPQIKEKVLIQPQPVPSWFEGDKVKYQDLRSKLFLFYPAAFYPHKKHDFIFAIDSYCKRNQIDLSNVEIWLTLSNEDFEQFKEIKFLKNLGSLNADRMNYYYRKAHGLLFISSMESYGLPLVEALTIGLPIITVNFEYAKWMCEDNCYYFKPYNVNSFLNALNLLREDLRNGRQINYTKVLSKFPISWDVVTNTFYKSLIK